MTLSRHFQLSASYVRSKRFLGQSVLNPFFISAQCTHLSIFRIEKFGTNYETMRFEHFTK